MIEDKESLKSPVMKRLRLLKLDLIQIHQKLSRFIYKLSKINWLPFLGLVLVVWYWFYRKEGIPLPAPGVIAEHGLYGDSFGHLTSLFTALGFAGLLVTLAFQQRQIKNQDEVEERRHRKEAQAQYEDVLFRLLDMYRQTLSEVQVGEVRGRDVLQAAIERSEKCIVEEDVHEFPRDIKGRYDKGALTAVDRERIDYMYYRNFKIISIEIGSQGRLLDIFEVLLEHMVDGAPDYVLINLYKDLVFAQITFIEFKYYFLVALSVAGRKELRDLLNRSGFLDRMSRSAVHHMHRLMYEDCWGVAIAEKHLPPNVPMSEARIERALDAHRAAGGRPSKKYIPLYARNEVGKKARPRRRRTKTTKQESSPSLANRTVPASE